MKAVQIEPERLWRKGFVVDGVIDGESKDTGTLMRWCVQDEVNQVNRMRLTEWWRRKVIV